LKTFFISQLRNLQAIFDICQIIFHRFSFLPRKLPFILVISHSFDTLQTFR